MTGGGMRQSSSGTANISDDPANSSSGISSISGGVAAASNGSRGGMAVQTDGSGDSNGSRGGLAVQADGSGGSNGSRGGMALQTDGGGGSNACISSTARQGGAQANATALPVDKPKLPVKVWLFVQAQLSAMTLTKIPWAAAIAHTGSAKKQVCHLKPNDHCATSCVNLLTCC